MERIFRYFLLMVTILSCFVPPLIAQDIHTSQFYETTIMRNPSLMGIYTEDFKVTGQYRSQWGSIGKGFRTSQFSAEFRFPMGKIVHDYLSVGLLFYSDKAGAINFKTTGFYPAINYNKSLDDNANSYVSAGFTGGYVTRSIDVEKMTFDNQYQQGSYHASNGHGEQQLPDPKLAHWDLGAGVSFNSSPTDKISYYLGVSGYHFTKPRRSFYNMNHAIRLDTRWSANVGISWFLDDTYSVLFHGNYMIQGPYREIIAGGFLRWSRTGYGIKKPFGLYGGVFYRFGDAIIPMVKVDWKGQSFAFSYDVNISTLRTVSQMRGGFEISLFTAGFLSGGIEDKRVCPRF